MPRDLKEATQMCDVTPCGPISPSTRQIEKALSVIERTYPAESVDWKIARRIFVRKMSAVSRPREMTELLLTLSKLEEGTLEESLESLKCACLQRTLIQKLLEDMEVNPAEDRSVFLGFGPLHLEMRSDDEHIGGLADRLSAVDSKLAEAFSLHIRTVGEKEARQQLDDFFDEHEAPRKYWWCYPVRWYKVTQELSV